jgi:hypothetical protein
MAGVRLYLQAVAHDAWRAGWILYFLVQDIDAARKELIARTWSSATSRTSSTRTRTGWLSG